MVFHRLAENIFHCDISFRKKYDRLNSWITHSIPVIYIDCLAKNESGRRQKSPFNDNSSSLVLFQCFLIGRNLFRTKSIFNGRNPTSFHPEKKVSANLNWIYLLIINTSTFRFLSFIDQINNVPNYKNNFLIKSILMNWIYFGLSQSTYLRAIVKFFWLNNFDSILCFFTLSEKTNSKKNLRTRRKEFKSLA